MNEKFGRDGANRVALMAATHWNGVPHRYDIAKDMFVPVTQDDVWRWSDVEQAYGQLLKFSRSDVAFQRISDLAEKLRLWAIGKGDRPREGL